MKIQVKDFPIKPNFSQERGGKQRVFNLQTHHKDGRAAEGNNLGLLGLFAV